MTKFCYESKYLIYLTAPAVYECSFADLMRNLKNLAGNGELKVNPTGSISYENPNVIIVGLRNVSFFVAENDLLRKIKGDNAVEASLAAKAEDARTASHLLGFTLDALLVDLYLREIDLGVGSLINVASEIDILRFYRANGKVQGVSQ